MHDPWVLLGAIAVQTSRIRIGTMVTPLSRRRPAGRRQAPDDPRPPQRRPGDPRCRPGRPAGPRLLRLRRRAVVPPCGRRSPTRRSTSWPGCCAGSVVPPRRAPATSTRRCGRRRSAAAHPDLDRRPGAPRPPAGAGAPVGRLRPDRRRLPHPRRSSRRTSGRTRTTAGTWSRSGPTAPPPTTTPPPARPGWCGRSGRSEEGWLDELRGTGRRRHPPETPVPAVPPLGVEPRLNRF